jgi:hypothetical protein
MRRESWDGIIFISRETIQNGYGTTLNIFGFSRRPLNGPGEEKFTCGLMMMLAPAPMSHLDMGARHGTRDYSRVVYLHVVCVCEWLIIERQTEQHIEREKRVAHTINSRVKCTNGESGVPRAARPFSLARSSPAAKKNNNNTINDTINNNNCSQLIHQTRTHPRDAQQSYQECNRFF